MSNKQEARRQPNYCQLEAQIIRPTISHIRMNACQYILQYKVTDSMRYLIPDTFDNAVHTAHGIELSGDRTRSLQFWLHVNVSTNISLFMSHFKQIGHM